MRLSESTVTKCNGIQNPSNGFARFLSVESKIEVNNGVGKENCSTRSFKMHFCKSVNSISDSCTSKRKFIARMGFRSQRKRQFVPLLTSKSSENDRCTLQ